MATNFSLCGFYTQWSYSWSFSWRRVWPVSLVCVKLLIVRYQTKTFFFSPHILSGFSKSVHLLIVYSLSSHSHICPDSFLFKIQTQMSVCLHMPASWMSTAWILQGVMSVRDWSPVRLDTRSTMTFVKVHYTLSALTSINVFTYIHSEYIVNGSKGVCELLCYYNVMKLHCSSVYKPYEYSPFTLKSPCNYDILSTQ